MGTDMAFTAITAAARAPVLSLADTVMSKRWFKEYSPAGWAALQAAFKALGDKLRGGVFDHGFLLR